MGPSNSSYLSNIAIFHRTMIVGERVNNVTMSVNSQDVDLLKMRGKGTVKHNLLT